MYSVVRIYEGSGNSVLDVRRAARARVEALDTAGGLVTLLAIQGGDGALITVEIFETLDELRDAQRPAGRDSTPAPAYGGTEPGRTISGEIVFQRGL